MVSGGNNNNHRRRGMETAQSALELPENLGARCALLYMWDEEYTVRALEGYLQFMELKANFEDWDCEQLAPPVPIDLVWQQHLLYNKQYSQACLHYCDQEIGYDPDASLLQDPKQEQRIHTTKIALKALFGKGFESDIWNFDGNDGMQPPKQQQKSNKKHIHNRDQQQRRHDDDISPIQTSESINRSKVVMQHQHDARDAPEEDDHDHDGDHHPSDDNESNGRLRRDDTISDSEVSDFRVTQTLSNLSATHHKNTTKDSKSKSSCNNNNTNKNAESVTVKIKCFFDGKTQDTCIRVKRTTKMKKVEDCLARLMGLQSAEHIRFLVDGEPVAPWESLSSLKVIDPEQHWFTVMPKVSAAAGAGAGASSS